MHENGYRSPVGGFTLIELLVVTLVAAIVMALAAPVFADIGRNARRTTVMNGLVRDMHYARSEAHKRARTVTLCAAAGPAQCALSARDWSNGWLVFENRDRDDPPRVDPGEPVLVARPALSGGRLHGNRRAFLFRPFNKRATAGTLVYCDDRGAPAARALIVSATGRPRVSDRDPRRRRLNCPAGR